MSDRYPTNITGRLMDIGPTSASNFAIRDGFMDRIINYLYWNSLYKNYDQYVIEVTSNLFIILCFW